jgi:hypothetical protein
MVTCPIPALKAESITPQILWTKTYEGYRVEDIIQTIDGGYAVIGNGNSGTNQSGLLIKLDSFGNHSWVKTYRIENSSTEFSRVLQTSDEGYIVAGIRDVPERFYRSLFMAKIDKNGNLLWNKAYSIADSLTSLIQTKDGGYLLSGDVPELLVATLVIKTDSAGNTMHNRTLSVPPFFRSAVFEEEDKSVVVIGSTQVHGESTSAYFRLFKLDADLNVQFDMGYGGGRNPDTNDAIHSFLSSAIETNDGGYFMAGSNDFGVQEYDQFSNPLSWGWVVKANQQGTMQWNKTYEDFTRLASVVQDSNGNYVLAGKSLRGSSAICTDSVGNRLWNLTILDVFYPPSIIDEIIRRTEDNNYVYLTSYRTMPDDNPSFNLVKIVPPSVLAPFSPSPEAWVVIVSVIVAVVGMVTASLWVYFKKHKRLRENK